jgi:hypothetical protein
MLQVFISVLTSPKPYSTTKTTIRYQKYLALEDVTILHLVESKLTLNPTGRKTAALVGKVSATGFAPVNTSGRI